MAPRLSAMNYFAQNVLHILRTTEGWSVSWLADQMNDRRKAIPRKRGETVELVSRTFLSNLLHGHKQCSIPFAEEVSAVIGVPLHELLGPLEKNLRQPA